LPEGADVVERGKVVEREHMPTLRTVL
jgi:hypothetical protein